MTGSKSRWVGFSLVAGASAGLLSLTSMMNSAFAYGRPRSTPTLRSHLRSWAAAACRYRARVTSTTFRPYSCLQQRFSRASPRSRTSTCKAWSRPRSLSADRRQ
jgi:hypothetical protein